ncbi:MULTISPECIES: hypothetical protein [unclassified Novosphingobium]|uniref:hypothetical protein n=1 Tax=unclassified Novosphingobium TaxID=2644732 RepID=UPI00146F5839|nr:MULTISPECIES: hypothetical protein [unclassified Novosphingobium]NMN07474.1 hypothetical protein [Novosphingobium sp. SG919]NMN89741.1 hypothetical protein [Novosphingobium sp. SG916]
MLMALLRAEMRRCRLNECSIFTSEEGPANITNEGKNFHYGVPAANQPHTKDQRSCLSGVAIGGGRRFKKASGLEFAMAIALCTDFDAAYVRKAARGSRDGAQT